MDEQRVADRRLPQRAAEPGLEGSLEAGGPTMRLLCFPFSGGSATSYRGLGTCFDSIEVSTFELPGRGRRFSEPALERCEPMVEDLLQQIRPRIRAPYALFGHSMGALLAYLIAKRVIAEGLPCPAHLFVSGSRAPAVIFSERWHLLPRQEFHRVLAELGGCPPAILSDPELMALYEPVLRADFGAMASYRHEPSAPFEFPITAVIGQEDRVSHDQARAWQQETVQPLRLERFAGGHFFIFRHWQQIQRLISARLSCAREGDPSGPGRRQERPPHQARVSSGVLRPGVGSE
ncbi:thioesterase II family protein [Variovorax sp. J22R115]|uniref:thioesterase II family protein n=1 Tax=Variovorax sp. J22R115 TaxID=3053509 RepID=UPI002579201F|nr:alpha/beta fold hydrolase [Variovorax sp. J22R115]MDM0053047.1 alpha/beta fold hydrolase [Variovorax sp. J22R115]